MVQDATAAERRRDRFPAPAAGTGRSRHRAAGTHRPRRRSHADPLRQRRPVRAPRRAARRPGTGWRARGMRRRRRSPWACWTVGSCVPATGTEAGSGCSPTMRSFAASAASGGRGATPADVSLESVTALRRGDYVVHLEHGIGIYRGIETIFVKESTVEVAVVEYEGGDRLNVPLYRIDQLERYRAAGNVSADAPPPRLHRLGGKRWAQQRDRTRAAIQEMTAELLDLYARRQVAHRAAARDPTPPGSGSSNHRFCSRIRRTSARRRPTSRRTWSGCARWTACWSGDVGYGKTEIAVRAAFKAVQSGRQVAVLVPTTILADQHLRTFGDRVRGFSDPRRGAQPLPDAQGAAGDPRRSGGRQDRRRHRHAPAPESRRAASAISG